MKSKLLEICCFNVESAKAAKAAGADRIEFCSPKFSGGGTPSENDFLEVKKIGIRTFMMLHPREGDYCYDDKAFCLLKQQGTRFKEMGVQGLVFGILDSKKNIDIPRSRELINYFSPVGVTLHKAFDETADVFKALEDAIQCGFKRILTSGTKPTALKGKKILAELVKRADGRISIMIGGGVRSINIDRFFETGATEFHSSALLPSETISSEAEIKSMLDKMKSVSIA